MNRSVGGINTMDRSGAWVDLFGSLGIPAAALASYEAFYAYLQANPPGQPSAEVTAAVNALSVAYDGDAWEGDAERIDDIRLGTAAYLTTINSILSGSTYDTWVASYTAVGDQASQISAQAQDIVLDLTGTPITGVFAVGYQAAAVAAVTVGVGLVATMREAFSVTSGTFASIGTVVGLNPQVTTIQAAYTPS